MLHNLREIMKFNHRRVEKMVQELTKDTVFFSNVDAFSVQILISPMIDSGVDIEFIRKTSQYRYELENLNRNLDTQYDLAHGKGAAGEGLYLKVKANIVEVIQQRSQQVIQPLAEELLRKIDKELED